MDAKEFLREYGSMCNKFECCDDCPMSSLKEIHNIPFCNQVLIEYPDESIKIVTGYRDKKRTRQSEYLRLFPESLHPMRSGVLDVCPNRIIRGLVGCGTPDKSCVECKAEFWLEEIK